jgi:molecular chaperone HtpG
MENNNMPKKSTTSPQSFNFKAETKQLLNILIHSLYKEREVFLRELLSNASDALHRLRFEMLTNQTVLDSNAELAIRISFDKENRLLTIQDNGIGMNRDEIIEHLGTIAESGARKFVQASQEEKQSDFSQIIGQFGVGFYSVFMVADWVRVTSRSYRLDDQAVSWYATGEDTYEVTAAEMAERGTRIEVGLKEDAAEFAEEFRVKNIIHRHSDYIGFPIYIGDSTEPANKRTSLWRTAKSDLTEEQYQDFYRQTTLDWEEPLTRIHFVTDAPVQLYALLYFPAKAERGALALRKDDGLKLYSRNILIDEYNKDLLPDYLRFVQGVVDSEDLPLNVSRETVQDSGFMPRLKKVLTGQVLKELESLAKKSPEKYESFWVEFGAYLKHGVASDFAEGEKLHGLLRFHTNLHPENWSSLADYAERMQADQKEIYYIVGDDSKAVLRSPHLDQFRERGLEVLLLTDPMDSFLLMGLHKYKELELKNVAQVELPEAEKADKAEEITAIPEADFSTLIERFKTVLGERVTDVRASKRLSQSVARLSDPEGALNPELQRVYKYLGKEYEIPKKILELNPTHPLLKGLLSPTTDASLQNAVIEQIYDNVLLVEGLHPDPAGIAERIQQIMQAALEEKKS